MNGEAAGFAGRETVKEGDDGDVVVPGGAHVFAAGGFLLTKEGGEAAGVRQVEEDAGTPAGFVLDDKEFPAYVDAGVVGVAEQGGQFAIVRIPLWSRNGRGQLGPGDPGLQDGEIEMIDGVGIRGDVP